jgi:hypothetical protein
VSRVQLIVDGLPLFDDDIPEFQTPRPDMIGADLRAGLDPSAPIAPWQKALLLAILGKGLLEQLSRNPKLQPIDVSIDVRPSGWTLAVDVPVAGADEVVVIESGTHN